MRPDSTPRIRSCPRRTLLALVVAAGALRAQGPASRIADLNTTLPSGVFGSSVGGLVTIGSTTWFRALEPTTGLELWKTDGTPGGTVLVKDIRPGPDYSSPNNFTSFAGAVWFSATDGVNGVELWKTDGTAAGTVMVKDVHFGPLSSLLSDFTVVGSTLFFTALDGANGTELWKTDGTTAGTTMVLDINPGAASSDPGGLTGIQGVLYFAALTAAGGRELWRTDGTPGGTFQLADIQPGAGSSNPLYLTAVGSTLFFSASSATGTELWKSNGAGPGTMLVRDIHPTGSSSPANLTDFGGTLWFSATNGTVAPAVGTELWKSDGTAAGTVLARDINPGTASSLPAEFTPTGRLLFFSADNGTNGRELWRTDNLPIPIGGPALVQDIYPGTFDSSPDHLTSVGSTLYFTAHTPATGRELWKSQGSGLDTFLVRDINPSAGVPSGIDSMAGLGSILVLEADDGASGSEVWKSDGTAAGTVLLKDINRPVASSNPVLFTDSRGFQSVFFTASDGGTGVELWKSDGTAAGTSMVVDLNPGAASSDPGGLTVVQGVLYFSALHPTSGRELWRSDGTPGGTSLVLDIAPGVGSSDPGNLINVAGTLFFSAAGAGGNELWKSDGTAGGTVQVAEIRPAAGSSSPGNFLAVGGVLYFSASNGPVNPAQGVELWRTDGTAAGTTLVRDLNAGAADSSPIQLTLVGGGPFFYFTAITGAIGRELWKSDGTMAGTTLVTDLRPGFQSSNPRELTDVNGTLYFAADDGIAGAELWKTDGTMAGTVLVKDVFPGAPSGAFPNRLARLGDRLLFSHLDGTNGRELWISDGTAAGTMMVTDVHPGSGSGFPEDGFLQALPGAGRALFAGTDGVNGIELWRTDGTAAGTVRHTDLNPGAGNALPEAPVLAGALQFFPANDGVSGVEPHVMRTLACGVPVGSGCPGTGGVIPQISVMGTPAIGNPGYGVQVTRAFPGSVALLVIGLGQIEAPLGGGCSLYVLPLLLLSLPTNGAGVATLPIALPPDPNLIGIQSFAQAAVADPGGAFAGYSITAGLKVVFGDG